MKRSAALTQLSREHHAALVLAKRALAVAMANEDGASRFMKQAVETFRQDLEPHFRLEEAQLLPALSRAGEVELVTRTLLEHQALRQLADRLAAADAASICRFGATLEAHVRFEERELFTIAEAVLPPATLNRIEQHRCKPQEPNA